MPPKAKLCQHGVLGYKNCTTCIYETRERHRASDPIRFKVMQAAASAAYDGHPWATGQREVAIAFIREHGSDKCQGCGRIGPTHLDHDHATGRFRGLLCTDCNRGLGCLSDNVDTLRRLITYLTCPLLQK